MIRYAAACDCGFTGLYKSRRMADHQLARHSCQHWHNRRRTALEAARREALIDRTPQPCRHKQARHRHGTRACYVADRCRCLPCAAANNAARDQWARAKAYGRYDRFVDADPARRHLRHLMAAGMGLRRIQQTSGVGRSVLGAILYGKHVGGRRRRPQKRITRTVHDKIINTTVDPAPGTPADPDQTRQARLKLQSLVALGWSINRLAARYGTSRGNMTPIVDGPRLLQHRTIQRIDRLYEQLSMTLPPQAAWHDKVAASRARNHAKARGWRPPLDLDDEQPDDWTATQTATGLQLLDEAAIWRRLHGDQSVPLTKAEQHECWIRWQAAGRGYDQFERTTGISASRAHRYGQEVA